MGVFKIGSTKIELTSSGYLEKKGFKARTIHIARGTFPPEKIKILDKSHPHFQKLFQNPLGSAMAADVFKIPEGGSLSFVFGGIYFTQAKKGGPLIPSGYLLLNPNGEAARVLAEDVEHFTSGGCLLLDMGGFPSLRRYRDFAGAGNCVPITDPHFNDYSLVIQSNVILVANGKEDGNNDKVLAARAALSANVDRSLSLVIAYEVHQPTLGHGLTLKEFGDLLVEGGSLYAINLDGGPSIQMVTNHPSDGVRNPIRRAKGEAVNTMPLLFGVER